MEKRKECYECANIKCPGAAAYNSIYCQGNRKYNEIMKVGLIYERKNNK